MEVVVTKIKLDESSSPQGGASVKCLLYEAHKQPQYDPVRKNAFKSEYSTIDLNMGFAQMKELQVLSRQALNLRNAPLAPF